MEPELLLGVVTAAIATALGLSSGGIASQILKILNTIRRGKYSYKKITFPDGKEEYIKIDSSAPKENIDNLKNYLEFEELVKNACEKVFNTKIDIQYGSGRPDFVVNFEGRTIAIEAKVSLDPVSYGEIKKLMEAEKASEMILVLPSAEGLEEKSRNSKISENFKIVTGSTLTALAAAIAAAVSTLG